MKIILFIIPAIIISLNLTYILLDIKDPFSISKFHGYLYYFFMFLSLLCLFYICCFGIPE